jgi:hypothetical protein
MPFREPGKTRVSGRRKSGVGRLRKDLMILGTFFKAVCRGVEKWEVSRN